MRRWKRFWWSVGGLLLAVLFLGVSFWRFVDEQVEEQIVDKGAVVMVTRPELLPQLTAQLPREGGTLPTEPWYLVTAAEDRIWLWMAVTAQERCERLLTLADKRMGTVATLAQMGEDKQALEAAVKGIYYWETARILTTLPAGATIGDETKVQIGKQGQRYLRGLQILKTMMNDPARGGIDRLIETVTLGMTQLNGTLPVNKRIDMVN